MRPWRDWLAGEVGALRNGCNGSFCRSNDDNDFCILDAHGLLLAGPARATPASQQDASLCSFQRVVTLAPSEVS